jgi:glutamate-ammonia-ligase adenylyltransferase
MRRFEAIRSEILQRRRDGATLRQQIEAMRARMRAELDRGRDGHFDLKQGPGGLVDLEFALQAAVLQHAAEQPSLLRWRATPLLIEALRRSGLVERETAQALTTAHASLLQRALDCSLDARPRVVVADLELEAARNRVQALWSALGAATAQD